MHHAAKLVRAPYSGLHAQLLKKKKKKKKKEREGEGETESDTA